MTMGRSRRAAAVLLAVAAGFAAAPAQAADAAPAHGFVGAEVQPIAPGEAQALGLGAPPGVFVRDVLSWGPAYAAGVRRGDVLAGFAGAGLQGLEHVVKLVQGTKPGQTVNATVLRRGETVPLRFTLGATPAGWSMAGEAAAVVPRFGLTLRSLTPTARTEAGVRWGSTGLLVTDVQPDGTGARMGLRPGDLIVAADRKPLLDAAKAEGPLTAAALLMVEGTAGFRAVRTDGAPLPAPLVSAGAVYQPLLGQGLLVLDVAHDTPAARAGLRPGDLLAKVAGTPADTAERVAGVVQGTRLDGTPLHAEVPFTQVPPPPPESRHVQTIGATVAALSADVLRQYEIRPSARGVAVTAVDAGSRAAAVGLRPGYVVVQVNQVPVTTPGELAAAMTAAEAVRTAEAVVLVEGPQGFRIHGMPLHGPAAANGAPALQWGAEPAR